MKRIFLIVLDSFGVGQLPDAEKFGDFDVNTLRACSDHIGDLQLLGACAGPKGIYIKISELFGIRQLAHSEGIQNN